MWSLPVSWLPMSLSLLNKALDAHARLTRTQAVVLAEEAALSGDPARIEEALIRLYAFGSHWHSFEISHGLHTAPHCAILNADVLDTKTAACNCWYGKARERALAHAQKTGAPFDVAGFENYTRPVSDVSKPFRPAERRLL